MRFGDGSRGALISRRGWRLFVEWWTPRNGRYRVWRFGPVEFHAEVPF